MAFTAIVPNFNAFDSLIFVHGPEMDLDVIEVIVVDVGNKRGHEMAIETVTTSSSIAFCNKCGYRESLWVGMRSINSALIMKCDQA